MITIEYTDNGEAVSDFNYSEWLERVKNNVDSNTTFKVSTSTPIFAIRLAIVKGEVDHKKIKFKYNDKESNVNEYGVFNYWPKGFADVTDVLVQNILSTAIKKKKNKS